LEAHVDDRARFVKTWEKEAATTRKVISRIPEGSDYRPDPKSRTAREIAWLIVREDIVLIEGLEKGRLEWTEEPAPGSVKEILDVYDRHQAQSADRLKRLDAVSWDRDVPFVFQGQEVMKAPGGENAWGFLLDQIHHRGQLTTYLRPMGSTVPQIYGPSADEP
jgi:uncharacterized damage-inducible protein DinB